MYSDQLMKEVIFHVVNVQFMLVQDQLQNMMFKELIQKVIMLNLLLMDQL